MIQDYGKEIGRRMIRNLLDIQILRMIQAEPLWGYRIKKRIETTFQIKVRHGALYSTLNFLEQEGFLTSQKQTISGRARRVYTITNNGKEYLQSYYNVLREHLEGSGLA